jgi:hypothetical protein
MHSKRAPAGATAVVALAVVAGPLPGCAGSTAPAIAPQAGLNCVDDSFDCINKRKQTLNALIADDKRIWVKQPATPEAYASGVRLFAFKKKKKELSCDELEHGRKEAEAAPASLKSAGNLLTPAQVSRGRMFASEVARELGQEFAKRCRKG